MPKCKEQQLSTCKNERLHPLEQNLRKNEREFQAKMVLFSQRGAKTKTMFGNKALLAMVMCFWFFFFFFFNAYIGNFE